MERRFELIDYRRLSRKRIILTAEQLSRTYASLLGDTPSDYFAINFDVFYDSFIYPEYGINLEEGDDLGCRDGEKVLGYFEAATNTIFLDKVLNDRNDLRHHKKGFTFWHELGHAFLHGEWLRTHAATGSTRIITVEGSLSAQAEEKLEQQANLFASRAAVPNWFLNFVMKSTFQLDRPIRYIGPSKYQLYAWGVRYQSYAETFHDLCVKIAYRIRHRFNGLSVEAISYRVQESDYVVDVSQNIGGGATTLPLFRTMPLTAGALLARA